MQLPDVRYARSGDLAIAFQVVGDSRPDVVFVRGIAGDLVSTWDQPLLVRHVEGLAGVRRLIMIDRRGTGLSDRVREVHSAETAMDDVRAVMDSVGSENAVLWAGGTATGVGVLFAATYPERCAGLVLRPRVKGTRATDYPWASMRTDGAISLRRAERLGRQKLSRETGARMGAGGRRRPGFPRVVCVAHASQPQSRGRAHGVSRSHGD